MVIVQGTRCSARVSGRSACPHCRFDERAPSWDVSSTDRSRVLELMCLRDLLDHGLMREGADPFLRGPS